MSKQKHRRKSDEVRSLANPSDDLLALFGALPTTAAGISVSREAALRVPAVSCAIRLISETIGTLPLHLFLRRPDGSKERAVSHPAYRLLVEDANDWTSAYDIKSTVTVDALTNDKGGFILANRAAGSIRELLRVDPAAMLVEYGAGDEPNYTLSLPNGGQRQLDRRDVIHVRFGVAGKCPLTLARECIATAIAQARHLGRLFGKGGRPSGVLQLPGKVNDQNVQKISRAWHALTSGEESGRTAVLEEGASFTPLTFNSVDLQFVESLHYLQEEIARAFRVPPHLIFELGRATWGNAAEMGQAFLQFSLLPHLEVWTGAVRRAVLSDDERPDYVAEFLVDDLQRADIGKRMDAYAKAISSRVMNPNEVRARENLPAYEGGDVFANPNTTTAGTPPPANDGGPANAN